MRVLRPSLLALALATGCTTRSFVGGPTRAGRAEVSLSPATLAVVAGVPSAVELVNSGGRSAEVASAEVQPVAGFDVDTGALPASVGPGATLSLPITYEAQGSGPAEATLRVWVDRWVLEVAVVGVGVGPDVIVRAPPLLTFVPCPLATELTLENPGATPIDLTVAVAFDGVTGALAGEPEQRLRPGARAPVAVEIGGDAPAEGSLTVTTSSEDPAGAVEATFPVSVRHVGEGEVTAVGTAEVALPDDADPASVAVTVDGEPAAAAVADGAVTVEVPVGPEAVVVVTYGVLAPCP